jgi:conjugative relaxase-like TrwC/TraI family protein
MVRFDEPCFLVRGAVEYFREHMAIGDYFTQKGQAEMTWVGSDAERLGLKGTCRVEDFESLCLGLHPVTGEKLMVRDKGALRRICYFGQISPPKDVSVLYLVGGDRRIGDWWREAVADTLREIEAVTATRIRRADQCEDRATGSMVATIVTHDANRALDPQLHTHVCIMNLTYDPAEERWKSVQPSGYYRHQGYFREVCYNKLAERMRAAGYEVVPARRMGFEIIGVPSELRTLFSKRRREILKEAAAAGAKTQDELQNVTLRTRARKTNATAATLREKWLAECGPHLTPLRAVIAKANGSSPAQPSVAASQAVASALAHVFERKSVTNDRVLLREALIAGRGQMVLDQLRKALAARERTGELVRSGDEIASREGLEAEQEFTGWANSQLKGHGPLGRRPATAGLGQDQAKAVKDLLGTQSEVAILQGDAGTGKTTCLKAVVAGIEQAGGRVFGCAPSAGAADVLRQELTAEADTLQQLLVNESLQRATRGRTLLVDEAGLVSVREMRDLCRLAARNGNRLLLVGDTKQHTSVEAGDALRCLQRYGRVPAFHLTEIRRQQDPDYQKAVALLARGDAFGAFNQLNRLGSVREMPVSEGLWQAAAADYVKTVRAGKSCLAISPVWAEIHEFTAAVREQLKLVGLLARAERSVTAVDPMKWTQEERRRVQNYQAGDVLTFHRHYGIFKKFDMVTVVRQEERQLVLRDGAGNERRLDPRRASGFEVGFAREMRIAMGDRLLIRGNLKAAGLRNGDLVEVADFREDGGIALKDGRSLPPWFRQFAHGYATTSHAAQGKTVDRGILLMAEAGIRAGNLKQAYVSNSRFRESQMIFTTSKQEAREAMMRPADRKLALEMAGPTAPLEVPPRTSLRARFGLRPRMAVTVGG